MDKHQASAVGERIRDRVIARLEHANYGITPACALTRTRVSALRGGDDLLFVELVALSSLVKCSPAVFFEALDTPADTLGIEAA